jgi:hypothetical protein
VGVFFGAALIESLVAVAVLPTRRGTAATIKIKKPPALTAKSDADGKTNE